MLPEIKVAPPGPRSRELAERLAASESPAFVARRDARAATSGQAHTPIVYARGEGSNVFDVDENCFVDLTAGFGALLLGYGQTAATRAANAANDELLLALGDVYASEAKVLACEAIAAMFPEPGARVMLGLSGADAITCALKTAALATKKAAIVAFEGSYHGLSHGPLAATGLSAAFRDPFAAQLGTNVTFAPYPSSRAELDGSLEKVRMAIRGGDVAAVLVEPILGRGGCIVPPAAFLPALRSMCDEAGALLVIDEIWTAFRTGASLASAGEGVVGDVVCLGKGLGGGVPISACVGRASVMAAWGEHGGSAIHTGTHFGSPPACAALLATLGELRSRDLLDAASTHGARAREEIAAESGDRVTVRGAGLMIGVGLADAAEALAVARKLLERGYIVTTGGVRGDALTLSPALTIEPAQLSAFAVALGEVVTSVRATHTR